MAGKGWRLCEAVEADEAPTVEGGQGGHEDFVLKSSNEDRRVHLILLINSPFASNIHAKTNFIHINTHTLQNSKYFLPQINIFNMLPRH